MLGNAKKCQGVDQILGVAPKNPYEIWSQRGSKGDLQTGNTGNKDAKNVRDKLCSVHVKFGFDNNPDRG